MSSRANEFISKIKQASDKEARENKRGNNKPRETHEPEHSTFEALDAGAFLCTKCLPTKSGTNGRRACMGEWFEKIRMRKSKRS